VSEQTQDELIVYTEAEHMETLLAYLEDKQLVTYDTETTGVHMDCEVVGLSLCAEDGIAFYCVTGYWDKELGQLIRNPQAVEICGEIVQVLKTKQLVMHNSVFDCRVTRDTWKIDLMPSVFHDSMIAAHLLDEEGPRGLKELGKLHFGLSAAKEQEEMKASVLANGGIWEDKKYNATREMYKADAELLGKYGAKDALLTWRLFHKQFEQLVAEGLDQFFYEDESMPLLRDVTYDLNTIGLRMDVAKLKQLEQEMTHEIGRLRVEIDEDISSYVKERPKFSVNSPQQLSWLLFVRLGQKFRSLTSNGKEFSRSLIGKVPYTDAEKRSFISRVNTQRSEVTEKLKKKQADIAPKIAELKLDIKQAQNLKNRKSTDQTDKEMLIEVIAELKQDLERLEAPVKYLNSQITRLYPEKYIQADKATLKDLSGRYTWVQKLLKMKSEDKLLGTYVKGLLSRVRYGVVYPRFNQTGTDSGRYSSSDPNFQNLPRDDKRIKSCVLARPGKVFVGADYSQLEPRVFASVSQDPRLLECFEKGEDFYSVVGIGIFGRHECSAFKKDKNAFAEMYPDERQIAKAVCLAAAYGTTAHKLAQTLRHHDGTPFTVDECQDIIDRYFEQFPGVRRMMLESHKIAKRDGRVYNLYGRPRRLPEAIRIGKMFPNVPHEELEYQFRTVLNLSMNFRVQGSAASIVNRACIAFKKGVKERALTDPRWLEVNVSSQIHDEIHAECPRDIAEDVKILLKDSMENTTILPGVALVAEPKIAENMAELK
jgi:DNA polymerase I-like protein with 3'-5' exonuclease and polymerase domains